MIETARLSVATPHPREARRDVPPTGRSAGAPGFAEITPPGKHARRLIAARALRGRPACAASAARAACSTSGCLRDVVTAIWVCGKPASSLELRHMPCRQPPLAVLLHEHVGAAQAAGDVA